MQSQICRAHGRPRLRKNRDLHAKARAQDNGSGIAPPHMSIEGGKPLFPGNGYAAHEMALYFIGGVLIFHMPARLNASPIRRQQLQRCAGLRSAGAARLLQPATAGVGPNPYGAGERQSGEFRFPRNAMVTNPYLATGARGGLTGKSEAASIHGERWTNLYEMPPAELVNVPTVCGSRRSAGRARQRPRSSDQGRVFSDDKIGPPTRPQHGKSCPRETTPVPSGSTCI